MENKSINPKDYSKKYGLIMGALLICYNLFLYFQDLHYKNVSYSFYVSSLIVLSVAFFAILAYRTSNEGKLQLREGLKLGTGAAAIAGLLVVIYLMILSNFIDPDFAEKSSNFLMENTVDTKDMSPEEILKSKQQGIDLFWIHYPINLISILFAGFCASLISAVVLRKS